MDMASNWGLSILLSIFTTLYFNGRPVYSIILYDVGKKPNDLCTSEIYCTGDLLHTVQLLKIFDDSKAFVDRPMKFSSAKIIASFEHLKKENNMNISALNLLDEDKKTEYHDAIKRFVSKNFRCGTELLQPATLSDLHNEIKLIEEIRNDSYQQWASDLNQRWGELARQMSEDVKNNQDMHSLIYVDNPFVIPGGRFKEFYYWDTYWIIKGLLLCEMYNTTRGMIENFLSMVERYGFVPNGGRVYYLMRSQPPLLIAMVYEYLVVTGDWDFVDRNLASLEKEFDYWMQYKSVKISKDGRYYTLSHYVTDSLGPRPESYREDYDLAKKFKDPRKKLELYNHLKAGAESGWDFSTRWFADKSGARTSRLEDIVTSDILPVDLNAFIEKNARILSTFFLQNNHTEKAKHYENVANNYRRAIKDLLWNEEDGTWYDFDMKHGIQRKHFYLSNLTPLYTESYNKSQSNYYGERTVEYLRKNNIKEYKGGMPTSLYQSSQQWDFPNVWAPLQSIVVVGLKKTSHASAEKLAQQLALQFLRSAYIGYSNPGNKMYEKYNAERPGETGAGGEYEPQDGFGWTNGVVLHFLSLYPSADNDSFESSRERKLLRDRSHSHSHLLEENSERNFCATERNPKE